MLALDMRYFYLKICSVPHTLIHVSRKTLVCNFCRFHTKLFFLLMDGTHFFVTRDTSPFYSEQNNYTSFFSSFRISLVNMFTVFMAFEDNLSYVK
jgi:hypothetical protein